MGAAVGTFTGLKVVKYNHDYIDRMLLRASIVPDGRGGTALAIMVPVGN